VTVYQLVDASTHVDVALSNRRCDDARRKLVIGNPSLVTTCLGVVAMSPVMVMVSLIVLLCVWTAPVVPTCDRRLTRGCAERTVVAGESPTTVENGEP
jgi:hypothetical protein